MAHQKHLIIITHGEDDGLAQACFALKLAVTLQNMGIEVNIYLASSATKWAHKDTERNICAPGFEHIQFYIDEIVGNGGNIFVCCVCYSDQCHTAYEKDMEKTLIKGAKCIGLNVLSELSLESKVFTF